MDSTKRLRWRLCLESNCCGTRQRASRCPTAASLLERYRHTSEALAGAACGAAWTFWWTLWGPTICSLTKSRRINQMLLFYVLGESTSRPYGHGNCVG